MLRHSYKFAYVSPKEIHSDLEKIHKALTTALQVLLPMELSHVAGQDLEESPFNWPLVNELVDARITAEIRRIRGLPPKDFERPCYPTQLLSDMVELRNAARIAAEKCKPGKGNSERRTARTSLAHDVGKNFVFRFRTRFGHMPPITKVGWVVDLLQEALELAGVHGVDASQVLRGAVQRDEAGRALPSAKDFARRAK